MVSRGTFDEIIKQESAGFRSSRNQDSGENARDRAARRLNVKSGKNPNPRTSTAYKPDADKPAARKKSKGGARDGGKSRTYSSSPKRAPMQGPPISAKLGDPQGPPISARSVDTGDPSALLIPLLIASIMRRRGGDGGPDAGGGPGGGGGGGGGGRMPPQPPFLPPGSAEAPPQEVPLSRVPNDPMSSNLLRPPMVGEGGAAGMDVQNALPMVQPRQLTYDPAALNDSNVTRFFNEGELGGMREAMPQIEAPRVQEDVRVPLKPRVRVKAPVRAR